MDSTEPTVGKRLILGYGRARKCIVCTSKCMKDPMVQFKNLAGMFRTYMNIAMDEWIEGHRG